MNSKRKIDVLWDDNPIDVTAEANFIRGIVNKLRGLNMSDKYGDVVIPMTILRRFECALAKTKKPLRSYKYKYAVKFYRTNICEF